GNIIYRKESGYENQLTVKGSSFYSADRGMVKKWDLTSGNMVTEWELGTNLHQVTFSPNDSLMAYEKSFYYNDSIIVWNLFLNSRVAAFQRPSQDKGSGFVKIYTPNYELAMRFSNDNKRLYYSSGEKGFISIMQLPFLEIYKYEDGADTSFNDMEMVYEEGTLEYFNDYLPIACSAKDSIDFISKDNEIGEDEIIGRDYYQRAKYGLKYPDFQRIIYLDEQKNQLHTATNKEWLIWDLKKKTILKKFTLPTAMRAIMYLPATQQLLLQSHDRIALQSMNDKTPAYFFSTLDKNETIAYRSDRFYMAGPSIAKWFSWNVEDKFYDFDQWDLQYNRPDKLLELVAQPDQNLHTAFLNAYSKRLQRNNVAEKDFSEDLLLPQTILLNTLKDGDQIMADSIVLQLKLIPVSKKSSLKNVLVYINDNPVWGRMGYALPVSKKTSQELQLVVKLSDGINRIKVSCTDVNGRESLREMLLVKHEPTSPTPVKTWFIGIGINRFEDSIHNLKWSVKDIRDLALKFKEKNNGSISIDTLFDEAVTTENIQRLQAKMQQTNINDRVIISYSGHGLLSSSFDYYLSTYPVNFKNPEQNGLPYEALESLADGIPARKKLILIDACHSGEVDKEEMKQMQEVDNTNASTGAKGTRPLLVNKIQQPGSKNSFELMQELFSNLSSNTGATIIAAAAGTQFALEKNSLQNGVFSYAILEMMQAQSGISISQLNEQISKRVTELTHGQQVPSARKENITDDWMLW
ncbi:MAG: caspase family protein, partial [Ferruginibacter sp.]